MIFLHVSPALSLVHLFVLMILVFGIIARNGAHHIQLLEFLLCFWQRLVVQTQLSQQFMHVLVFVKLSQGF
jgi:hypothetical protein